MELVEIWRLSAKPAQRSLGVGDCRGDRLIYFVSDGRRQLAHRCDAVRVRQLHLRLAVPPLAIARFYFCLLALSQIEHECDGLASAFFDGRRAKQNGHPAAVLSEVLLLNRRPEPGPPVLFDPLCVPVAPIGRRQVRPA